MKSHGQQLWMPMCSCYYGALLPQSTTSVRKTPGCVGVHACFLYAHGFMLSFNNSEVPYFAFAYRQGCSALGVVNF